MTTTPTTTTTTPPSTPILYGPLNVEYLNGWFHIVCLFVYITMLIRNNHFSNRSLLSMTN